MDPKTRDQALTHIQESFDEATQHNDNKSKQDLAFEIGERLLAPITYPARLMNDTYADYSYDPQKHQNENAHSYAIVIENESAFAAKTAEVYTRTMESNLYYHEPQISSNLYCMEQEAEHRLEHLTRALQNTRPRHLDYRDNLDLDQIVEHSDALAQAIYKPIQEKLTGNPNHNNPFETSRSLMLSNHGENAANDTQEFASQLDIIRQQRQDHLDQQLEQGRQDLAIDLVYKGNDYTLIHKALTHLDEINQKLDYPPPSELANDLHAAFEESIKLTGESHRTQMAQNFATALTYSLRNDGAINSFDQDLDIKITAQAQDLADRMGRNQYDENDIRALNDSLSAAQRHLEHSADHHLEPVDEQRTNLMISDMEQHLIQHQPETFHENGQTWTERLENPRLLKAMVNYTQALPDQEQASIANEIIRRSQQETVNIQDP